MGINKLMELDKGSRKQHFVAAFATAMWSLFLLDGALAALTLRGDIHPQDTKTIGTVLAVFVLFVLLTIVYKANFEKEQ